MVNAGRMCLGNCEFSQTFPCFACASWLLVFLKVSVKLDYVSWLARRVSSIAKWDLCQVCKFGLPSGNPLMYHINRLTKKNHMIISVDTEKVFDKIHHSFFIKLVN